MSDDDFEVPREEVLKEEGNRLFSIRRYAKAAEKCGALLSALHEGPFHRMVIAASFVIKASMLWNTTLAR